MTHIEHRGMKGKRKAWYNFGCTSELVNLISKQQLDILTFLMNNECYSLSSMHLGVLRQDPSVRFKCTLGDSAFSASAPQTWNALSAKH